MKKDGLRIAETVFGFGESFSVNDKKGFVFWDCQGYRDSGFIFPLSSFIFLFMSVAFVNQFLQHSSEAGNTLANGIR